MKPKNKNANIANKKKALAYFQERILANDKENNIAKIYLFGSMAKEEKIRIDSDIDLIIFSKRKASSKIKNIIDSEAFETAVKFGESVEPLIYSYTIFKSPRSVFVQKVIKEGKQLYSSI